MSPLVSLPGGQLRDEIRNPLYDSDDLLAGQSPVGITRFFSSITNPDGSPKGLEQSNLVQANSLPTATSFRCQGYSIDAQSYFDANRLVLPIIQDHSSIQLQVGEKVYATLAWVYLGGRLEVKEAVAISGAVAPTTVEHNYVKFGQSAVAPIVLTGKHVIDILPVQQFTATWNCQGLTAAEVTAATPAAGTQIRFYFSMKGLLRRAVQ
jgi:hypothetical protein